MSKLEVTEEQVIPRLIIQSDKKKTNKKLTSGYLNVTYNEEDASIFIEKNFTDKELFCFNNLENEDKFHFWKFCFLYINGGVYLQEGIVLLDQLDKLVSAPETLYYDSNFNVSDRFIAMQKNNPVMLDTINLFCNRIALMDDENTALNVLDKVPDNIKTDPEKIAQMCIATEQELDINDVSQLKARMKWWATGPILLNDVVYSRITGKMLNCAEYILPVFLKEKIVKQLLKGSIDDVCSQSD
tara:strand:+ start:1178 stop:1903 length:726 start_codon:yes stop_codon:yes gene_type:complete